MSMNPMLKNAKSLLNKFGLGEETRAVIVAHMHKSGFVEVSIQGSGSDCVFLNFTIDQNVRREIMKKDQAPVTAPVPNI